MNFELTAEQLLVKDSFMRFCIAREDEVLQGALDKIQGALSERQMWSFRSR